MTNEKSKSFIFQLLSTSFCVIVITSNILSAKMVALPWLPISIPAGLVTFPLTFVISNLTTEIFGAKSARRMVYMALGMNLLCLGLIQMGLWLPAGNFKEQAVFQAVLGLSGMRIFSSVLSYAVSQLLDVQLYASFKNKGLWLKNNGAACISQLVDTLLVDILFLWWGLAMPFAEVLPIMLFSYLYKALFSFAATPLFYLFLHVIKNRVRFISNKGSV